MLLLPWLPLRRGEEMLLKIERNGRQWKNKRRIEEVLDVFHGEDFKEKLSRGFCLRAFKEIIKEPLEKGEALILKMEIEGNEITSPAS